MYQQSNYYNEQIREQRCWRHRTSARVNVRKLWLERVRKRKVFETNKKEDVQETFMERT